MGSLKFWETVAGLPSTTLTMTRSGDPNGLYVDTECCLSCGVPWDLAPEIFADGEETCVVKRQPATPTEYRRVLRVFRTQDLGCVRYGGQDPRVLRILRRAGCAFDCDANLRSTGRMKPTHHESPGSPPSGDASASIPSPTRFRPGLLRLLGRLGRKFLARLRFGSTKAQGE